MRLIIVMPQKRYLSQKNGQNEKKGKVIPVLN
jgi:hypothetical protein